MERNKLAGRAVNPAPVPAAGPRAPLSEPVNELEIPRKLGDLAFHLDALDTDIGELVRRLCPVLRAPDLDKSDETAAAAQCELGHALQTTCERLYAMTKVVRGILATLQV